MRSSCLVCSLLKLLTELIEEGTGPENLRGTRGIESTQNLNAFLIEFLLKRGTAKRYLALPLEVEGGSRRCQALASLLLDIL